MAHPHRIHRNARPVPVPARRQHHEFHHSARLAVSRHSRRTGLLSGTDDGTRAIVIALGAIYDQYAGLAPVRRAFIALSAAAAAYLLASAWKIAAPLRGRPLAIAVAACTFVAIAVLRLPLPAAMPVLALGSTLLLWRFRA
jgi:hypothetical protein